MVGFILVVSLGGGFVLDGVPKKETKMLCAEVVAVKVIELDETKGLLFPAPVCRVLVCNC